MGLLLFRIYLVLAIIILVFYLLRKFIKTPPQAISLIVKRSVLVLLILSLLFLAITGRLNWFFALFSVVFAFALRMLPWLARYMPQLHRLWLVFSMNKKQSSTEQVNKAGKMTVKQAYEVLGLDPPASRQQIILSHKKLIQKLHPDRGGSDYLAVQINQAKEVLLKNK